MTSPTKEPIKQTKNDPTNQNQIKKIVFAKLPIPPSSNNQYFLARRGDKTYHIPSDELRTFQTLMKAYPVKIGYEWFKMQVEHIRHWILQGHLLEIQCYFFFDHSRLFTKQDKPKRLDVSNRIKAMHDNICDLLNIDDCHFFKIYAEKGLCHKNCDEMTVVEINRIEN